MLNVPDEVKALFKQDGVRKNFRVHFPNGELPDITNENIIQESVKFTESMCSQDVLKFGLTEASVIEFETVGIGNMYGMQIECGIEIDLSSLTPAQLNDIATGTWDGVYTDSASSDIGFAYFRVPYGVFRIESCPRDHQAMAHRKVKAYNSSSISLNPYETDKLKMRLFTNKYKPNLYLLFCSFVSWNNPEYILENGFSMPAGTISHYDRFFGRSDTITLRFSGGSSYAAWLKPKIRTWYTDGVSASDQVYVDPDALYFTDLKDFNADSIISRLADELESLGVDAAASGYDTMTDLAKAFVSDFVYPYAACQYIYKPTGTNVYRQDVVDSVPITQEYKAIYTGAGIPGYAIDMANAGRYTCAFVDLCGLEIRRYGQGGSEITVISMTLSEDEIPSFSKYDYSETLPTISLSIGSTLEGKRNDPEGNETKGYSFINSYSPIDLINGFLELSASYGQFSRGNKFVIQQLSNSSPVSVIPGMYSELWWDEYEVLPIGSVKYTYTNSNNEECVVVYQFGSGASIYDMSGNEVLKAMNSTSESTINALLNSLFIPNISAINFTPIDLTMKGLPYMKAGDYLAVTAEDGMIANSFNMRQEINGIQVLTATIESTSGDIIESGESV